MELTLQPSLRRQDLNHILPRPYFWQSMKRTLGFSYLACRGGGLWLFLALLPSHQEFRTCLLIPSLSTHSSKLPISVTVSLLWDSCSSSFSDSESCRDNLVLFRLPARRMLEREPPFFTRKLRVPLIWSKREPPILIFLLGTVLKE